MRGMPFQLQGKGVFEIAGFAPICAWNSNNHKKEELLGFGSNDNSTGHNNNKEPTSVLHMRRSPSPPTSASTLSSSFGGGGGGGSSEPPPAVTAPEHGPTRKDEWASELQPFPSGLEAVTGGGERCALGLEDWESMLSETAASPSHGQEHSLLRWIAGDVDDPSFGLKQLLQTANNPLDLDGNAGLGVVDQGPGGFEPIGGVSGTGNLITSINPSPNLSAFPASGGFTNSNSNSNSSGKNGGTIVPSSSGVLNYKVSGVGLNSSNNSNCNIQNPVYCCSANSLPLPVTLHPGMIYQQQQFEAPDEKPQIVNPQVLLNQQPHSQNPNFFLPLSFSQQEQHLLQPPHPKRPNWVGLDPLTPIPKVPFGDPGHEFLLRKHQQQQQQLQPQHLGFSSGVQFLPQHHLQQQKPQMVPKLQKMGPGEEDMAHQHHQQQQQQLQQQQFALVDQLYKAAELVETGNFSHAQGILARLNHQLSPVGKPLHRAAFYFKEALQLLLLMNNPVTSPPPRSPTPFDVIFKMGAYKVFSEISPLIQFVNFTCNQALLEALDDVGRIHIVDFDIGFGAQWASFMQELPVRNRGAPSLKITAFASPYTHHAIELGLMRDNLTQFANEIGISFELEVVNFDCLDQASYSLPILRAAENEAVAVNFPIWSSSNQPAALPSLLRFVKQLSPKIVVSLDRGCDRTDLPFPQHVVQALHSYINLLESLDAVNVTSDAVSKIEKFLLQPKIESTVLGRFRAPDKMPLWKTLFASAGFSPLTFSNFTETQAECVVKRTPVRGFHVEKRQASLVLCWQHRELISASAWRC
ncbi:scarecrow-like protein 22 [Alnus glutinosa]|uniref:scarecrow-like protein 22 n=1 Tax=Alnus glutinosa TaxID=3517 RepID=UPI002D789C70|nr:scarecrow-like protein 22 [Alnus glutinosa]